MEIGLNPLIEIEMPNKMLTSASENTVNSPFSDFYPSPHKRKAKTQQTIPFFDLLFKIYPMVQLIVSFEDI